MSHIWHPCMSSEDLQNAAPIKINRANGVWLYDENNHAYIDAISSWWVNIHGHNNDYLNSAIMKQAAKFSHIMTANFTHEEMEKLSENLIKITNNSFDKVIFTSDGSSAIEASLKICYQFFINQGINKPLFISFENAYHGETIGALAVGGDSIYKDAYKNILPNAIVSKMPKDESGDEIANAIAYLENIFDINKDKVCAVILEPLLQCAGGMLMHSSYFVKKVKECAKKHGAFLILDEIAVGFGRTGTMFAHEQADIAPDILCLSKALGAGYLPIAASLVSKEISSGFKGGIDKAFLHSHSHTGNALACAVANASLELFYKNNYIESNKTKIDYMRKKINGFKDNSKVLSVRQIGMVAAIETTAKKRISADVTKLSMQKNVFLRPLGSVIYTMPPYCIEMDEIDIIFDAIKHTIDNLDI